MAHGLQIKNSDGSVVIDYSDKSALIIGTAFISFPYSTSGTTAITVTIPGLISSDNIILNVYLNQRLLHAITVSGENITITRTNSIYSRGASDVLILALRI